METRNTTNKQHFKYEINADSKPYIKSGKIDPREYVVTAYGHADVRNEQILFRENQ